MLCTVVVVCGLYYLLFVDVETEAKVMTIVETTTICEVCEDDFIIEVEPVNDYISSQSETKTYQDDESENISNDTNENNSWKIDINSATIEELQTLKNIGPVVASNIVSYRKEYGDFADIEDIKNVKGIGKAKFASIKDFIYVK